MAVLSFYQTVDMLQSKLFYGDVTAFSGTSITIDDKNGNKATYYGNFIYDQFVLSSGILTGADVFIDYSMSYSLRDTYMDAVTIFDFVYYGDAIGLEKLILSYGDTIYGTANNDILAGWLGNDYIFGGAGNDVLYGGADDDTLDGGLGVDTARYDSFKSDYSVIKTSNALSVSGGVDGHDTLINIERLHFSDTNVAFDINGNAGQAYRLYQAAFDRKPDANGLSFWMDYLDSGHLLKEVATGFINSAEFINMYGENSTADQFVTNLYGNVLHRAPDQQGFDYWVDSIVRGINNKEDVLVAFSESTENQVNLIDAIGLDVGSNAGQAYRIYQAAFDRKPDNVGLSLWINYMNSGHSITEVATGFIGSDEFIGLYGENPTADQFVTNLYGNVLHRAPDQYGFDYWVGSISNGVNSKEDVLVAFSESPENQVNLIDIIGKGIDYVPYQ